MSVTYSAPVICLPSAQRPLTPTVLDGFRAGTIWVEIDTNLSYVLKYTGAVPSWIGLNGPSGGAIGPIYALDPSGATPGSYPTWHDLYAAYTKGLGPALIVVYGNAVVPAGTYPLREFTRFAGPTGASVKLTVADGGIFTSTSINVYGLDIESLSSSPCFVLSLNVDTAVVALDETSNLIASGTSPMIRWSVPAATIARLLVELVFESAFLNNGSAVIDVHGPGAGNPTVLIELGDGGVLGANTITSNADATVIVAALSPTASVGAQPGYLGSGTPFVNPSMAQTINIDSQGSSIINCQNISLSPVATYGALPTPTIFNEGAECFVTGLNALYKCVRTSTSPTFAWQLVSAGFEDPLDADDLLYWALNDTAAPAVNSGTTGSTDNLTVATGAPTFGIYTGPFGSGEDTSVNYNGATPDCLKCAGRAANTPPVGSFTVRCWSLVQTWSATQTLVSRSNTANVAGFPALAILMQGPTDVIFRVTANGVAKDVLAPLPVNGWHQFVLSVQGQNLYAFIDGYYMGTIALGHAADLDSGGHWTSGNDDAGVWPAYEPVARIRVRTTSYTLAQLRQWAIRDNFRGVNRWSGVP